MGNSVKLGRRTVAATAVGVLALTFLWINIAGASSSRKVSTLRAGLNYYQGKTLTFIAPSTAGSQLDEEARISAPLIGAYLHATVVVEDIPGANDIPGQDAIAHAAPNGLTFGTLQTAVDGPLILANIASVNFNPEREAFVGAFNDGAFFMLSAPNGPVTSFHQAMLISSPSSPLTWVSTSSGYSHNLVQLTVRAFLPNTRIITGYANAASLVTGFLRGDGQIMLNTTQAAGPLVTGGQGRALAVLSSGPVPKSNAFYTQTLGVPTIPELAKKYPPKTPLQRRALAGLEAFLTVHTSPVVLPTITPLPQLTALRAAFISAMKNPSVQSQFASLGIPVGYFTSAQAKQSYIDLLKKAKPIIPLLGLTG